MWSCYYDITRRSILIYLLLKNGHEVSSNFWKVSNVLIRNIIKQQDKLRISFAIRIEINEIIYNILAFVPIEMMIFIG